MEAQRTRRAVLRAGALGVAALAGCTGTTNDGSTTTETTADPTTTVATTDAATITDDADRTVALPATIDRIVGLGPGALRLLSYLGAADRVVGVEELETANANRPYRPYTLANPSLMDLPSVGSRKSPDAELLLQREPDVVFWAWATAEDADALASKLDVPVVVLTPGDLGPKTRPSFFETLTLLGDVLDASDRAASLVETTKTLVDDLESRSADVEHPPEAYVGYLGRGKHGIGRTQPLYPPFDFTNVDNVASGVTDHLKKSKGATRATVDTEQIIKWNPEYLFVDLGTESYDTLGAPEFQSVTAIEQDQVYGLLPNRDYSINFGSVLANAYDVGTVLYPDRFADVDPESKADDIFETFVGARVYQDLASEYGDGYRRIPIP